MAGSRDRRRAHSHGAAVIALADPQFVVNAFVMVIATGLVIGGLFRIGVGAFATVLPSPMRALNTGGGIIAFVLGVAALLDLGAALSILVSILALALLLVGAFEIGVGVARHPPSWLRISVVALGALTIILAGVVTIYTSVGVRVLLTCCGVGMFWFRSRLFVIRMFSMYSLGRRV